MFKPAMSLRNFFQRQATDEAGVTAPADTVEFPDLDTAEDTTGDAAADAAEDEPAETPADAVTDEPTEEATTTLDTRATDYVRLERAEFAELSEQANAWRTYSAELDQLRTWYANAKSGAALPRADASNVSAEKRKSYEMAPWNQ